jgi:rubrerythrin
VATQLLAGQGFTEVYNLKGGIKAWQGQQAAGPMDVGMAMISGRETPAEIILLAYGMEEGLKGFYELMAERSDSKAVLGIFEKLAGVEVRHKEKLFELFRGYTEERLDQEAFERDVVVTAMEGGLTTEEFLASHQAVLETREDVVGLAMELETQALDLYLRYSSTLEDGKAKEVMFQLAEEEKAHLRSLGSLMEEIV